MATRTRPMNSQADRPSWFLSHWRGETSLGISYWLNGILLGTALPNLVLIVYSLLTPLRHHFRLDAVVTLILVAAQISLWVWVVVGVIRSANRHTSRGGKLFWANTARVVICISVIVTIVRIESREIPRIRMLASLAVGRDPLDTVSVDSSTDGRTITLDGTIGIGSVAKFQRVLDASPDATTLILNSDGGREVVAQELALRIGRRHLNTFVEDHCVSACTFLFLAGTKREADDDADLGFHQPTAEGLTSREKTIMIQEMVEYYRSQGLREWFIDRIVATSPENMWYPTPAELKEGGVLN
jgi:hypothetical protein